MDAVTNVNVSPVDLTWEDVVREFHRNGRYTVAASSLGMNTVANICKRSMATLEFIAREGFDRALPEGALIVTREEAMKAVKRLTADLTPGEEEEEEGEDKSYRPEEGEEEEEEEGVVEEEEAKDEQQGSRKESQNKKQKCYVKGCSFFGQQLRRHLKVHVKRNDISSEELTRYLGVATSGKAKRGPK